MNIYIVGASQAGKFFSYISKKFVSFSIRFFSTVETMQRRGFRFVWQGRQRLVGGVLVGLVARAAALSQPSQPKAGSYSIGTPGRPWGAQERADWYGSRSVVRSYRDEVVSKLAPLRDNFDLIKYGALSADPQKYPLWAAKTRAWSASKPCVLITGGVHGYETSGVQGALLFLKTSAAAYSETFNIVVAPCVSPWGYETVSHRRPIAS